MALHVCLNDFYYAIGEIANFIWHSVVFVGGGGLGSGIVVLNFKFVIPNKKCHLSIISSLFNYRQF